MAQHSLTLRCMYGCLASGPDIKILHVQQNLDDFAFTQICCNGGDIFLREETDQNRIFTDVVARLKIWAPVIELETFIPGTTVEAPPSAFLAQRYDYTRLSLPQSTTGHRHYIHLRPQDTIDFCALNVKIEILLPHEPLARPISAASPVTMPPALPAKALSDVDSGIETESDDDLGKQPQPSSKLDATPVSRNELTDSSVVTGNDGPHETQDTQPLGRPELPAHQTKPESVIDESEPEKADDGSTQPLRIVTGISHNTSRQAEALEAPSADADREAETAGHEGDTPVEITEGPISDDDGGEVSEGDVAEGTTTAKPGTSSSAARGVKRRSVARTDQYDIPASSAKKRKGLPKAALDSHDIQDESADTNSVKRRKVAAQATPASEDDGDEITVAPASVKPRKSLRSTKQAKSTPAKRANSTPAKRASSTPANRATTANTTRSSTPSSTSTFVGSTPKILLSRSELAPAAKSWMTRNNITRVDETPSKRTNFVCVVRDGSLPATIKVLKTLMAGKPVVGDSWILASWQEGELQNVEDYVHPVLKGIDADPASRRSLFTDLTLFFTVAAATSWGPDWNEIIDMAKAAGAREVLYGNASKGNSMWPQGSVILFGLDDKSDGDTETLIKIHQRRVYNKSEFAQWVIHADVDLASSPQLTLPLGKKKGRK